MSRTGAALFVALVVVVLGGLIAVTTTMVAVSEIRAGSSWRDQQVAVARASTAAALAVDSAQSAFDSLAPGGSAAVADSVTLLRLGDSLGLLTSRGVYRSGQEVVSTVVLGGRDSLGNRRLTASRSRARYRPIP
jgi:hypothetical protein